MNVIRVRLTWVLMVLALCARAGRSADVPLPSGTNQPLANEPFAIEHAVASAPLPSPAPVARETNVTLTADQVLTATNPVAPRLWAAEDQVVVPMPSTIQEAIEHVFRQLNLVVSYELVPTNMVTVIRTTPCAFATDKPVVWRTALREILRPADLAFMEDERIVRLGPLAAIEQRQARLEEDRLRENHTRIELNGAGGLPLHTVLRFIQKEAGISMNFDYLPVEDRGVMQTQEPPMSADKAATPQPVGKISTYQTPEGQKLEWRVVLSEVLDPFGCAFVEIDGTVRPMTKEMVKQQQKSITDAKPLVARLVRVYHADPKSIIACLKAIPNLIKHSSGGVEVAQPWDANSKRYSGGALGQPTLGAGEKTGGSGGGAGVSFGGMDRPSTPPSILVRDVEENLACIEARIKELDRAERQILIEARILDLGKNASRELGVKWNEFGGGVGPISVSLNNVVQTGRSSTRDSASGESSARTFASTPDAAVGTLERASSKSSSRELTTSHQHDSGMIRSAVLTPLQLEATWNAIMGAGDSKVVSQPVIVVGDHCEAVIQSTTLTPIAIRNVSYVGTDSPTPVTTYSWQTLSIGIMLWVRPEICEDGERIRLSVHPQVSEPTGIVVESPDGSYPEVESRELDTRVTVSSGSTLLLGGLIKSKSSYTERKIPLLGDIPVIGWLFKMRLQTKDRGNLVMLITPTLLDKKQPDTGYEKPSLATFAPETEGLGRNLNPADHDDLNTKFYREGSGRALSPADHEDLNTPASRDTPAK